MENEQPGRNAVRRARNILIVALLAAFIICLLVVLVFVTPEQLVSGLGVHNGYILAFFVPFFGGFLPFFLQPIFNFLVPFVLP